ncbi:restriction endonuclease subunit S [Paenibacillus sp. JSM ZJ436]|uniref:restriction endonuclease subunit S n=1 Tax=Paenibacillus sp. JSM ZJ436 TaxID=3376190 RepID=UPI0037CB27C0
MDKWLDGFEVEWKALGEIGEFTRGKRFVKTDMHSEGFPCIHYGEMYTHYNIWAETTKSFVSHDLASNLRVANHGDVVIVAAGETIEDIGRGTAWLGNTGVVIHDACFSYRSSLNPKYVSYFLRTNNFHNQIKKHISSGKISSISAKGLSKAKIPIPPYNIQEKIVHILDNFIDLTAELTAELTARKKQYTFYLNKLLTFNENEVDWKSLGDVGEFTRGKRFVKTDMLSEGFPCIHYGEMYTHYNIWAEKTKSFVSDDLASKLRIADHGDVVIVAAGETIEDIGKGTAWLGNTGVAIHDACFSYRSFLNPKYVSYFTRTKQFHNQIKKHISSGKISAINANGLSKTIIPIPPIEEQDRIVSILDKFDALTSSIREGLPREIELRQKQYEYYRNMLLTFPNEQVKA